MKTMSNNKGKKAVCAQIFELPRRRLSRDPRVAAFKDVWDCSLRRFIFSRQFVYSESALGEHVDDLLVNAAVSMH